MEAGEAVVILSEILFILFILSETNTHAVPAPTLARLTAPGCAETSRRAIAPPGN